MSHVLDQPRKLCQEFWLNIILLPCKLTKELHLPKGQILLTGMLLLPSVSSQQAPESSKGNSTLRVLPAPPFCQCCF